MIPWLFKVCRGKIIHTFGNWDQNDANLILTQSSIQLYILYQKLLMKFASKAVLDFLVLFR